MSVARTAASVPAGSPGRRPTDIPWFSASGTLTSGTALPIRFNTTVVNDFEPIALLADAPLLLVAKKAIPANDLKELIAWLKANPVQASMGTVGAGSPGHLLGLLMQQETGTRFGLVAYRGAGPQTQDLV